MNHEEHFIVQIPRARMLRLIFLFTLKDDGCAGYLKGSLETAKHKKLKGKRLSSKATPDLQRADSFCRADQGGKMDLKKNSTHPPHHME